MMRRVPKIIPSKGNLFNYIPKACPEYKKTKKCSKGDACYLAHGWLEIIYHPLLFKTKLCESSLKEGVCSEYGIFCAKAHNQKEVRNLVKIFGKDWKRHYEPRQLCEFVKPFNRKEKHKRSERADVSAWFNSSRTTLKNHCPSVLSAGMRVVSPEMYGGSPSLHSQFQLSESTDYQVGLLMNDVDSIALSDLGNESSVGGWEGSVQTTNVFQ